MLSAMAPHEREMSQDPRKKIIYLHKKGEGLQEDQQSFTYQSEYYSKSGTNI